LSPVLTQPALDVRFGEGNVTSRAGLSQTADFLLRPDDPSLGLVETLSAAGQRLLAVVTSDDGPVEGGLPPDATTLAIVELEAAGIASQA